MLSRLNLNPNIQELIAKGFIDDSFTETLSSLQLTDKSKELLGLPLEDEVDKAVGIISKLWENTRPGAASTKDAIKRKLNMFCHAYPEFNLELILTACAYYVEQQRKNNSYKYLKRTAQFILEGDVFDDAADSALYSYCLSVQNEDDVTDNMTRA